MGLLDNNNVLTTPRTGLEGSKFKLVTSNDSFDMWAWRGESKADGAEGSMLRVTFRDIYVWSNNDTRDNALFMVKGKPTDTPVKVEVNDTNFPGLRKTSENKWPLIRRVCAVPTDFITCWGTIPVTNQWEKDHGTKGTDCRINVFFENGQVYHNYQACYNTCDFYGGDYAWINPNDYSDRVRLDTLFTKFCESAVWDSPDRKSPTNESSLVNTGAYYYNPALPSNCYEMHPAIGVGTGYSNTEGFPSYKQFTVNSETKKYPRFWRVDLDDVSCNSLTWMGGYACDDKFTMVATYNTNSGTAKACRMCVFATTDGGRNWYNIYEFAGNPRLKIDNVERAASTVYGIPLAMTGEFTGSGLQCRRKIIVVPTAESKEPSTVFEYGEYVDVSSIAGTSSSITVTTSSAHGFTNGDHIHFKGTANNDFNWIINDGANSVNGGNGIFFIVKNVTSTTFEITMNVYNSNSSLPIRHIHSLNRCKDGVSINTGEQYPQGWVIYGAIQAADTHAIFNPWNPPVNWVRLNSTSSSMQRPLGTIVKQELVNGIADTVIYYGADNEFTPMGNAIMPSGRTETFSHNSVGVYKLKLSDVDDNSKWECILADRENCYVLQMMDNALVFFGQFGCVAISYDMGKSWTKAIIPKDVAGEYAQFSGMTYDRMFSVGNTLIQLKK